MRRVAMAALQKLAQKSKGQEDRMPERKFSKGGVSFQDGMNTTKSCVLDAALGGTLPALAQPFLVADSSYLELASALTEILGA
jgi:hypothetical protein